MQWSDAQERYPESRPDPLPKHEADPPREQEEHQAPRVSADKDVKRRTVKSCQNES